jgi:hypothetical protein
MKNSAPIDSGSVAVMVITFIFFAAALFSKGFTHELLLEAGVFLVSVKLIIMVYRNGQASAQVNRKLDALAEQLKTLEAKVR